MQWDLERTPFSRRGSYLAFSFRSAGGPRKELFLRTVRGIADVREILFLVPIFRGEELDYSVHTDPWELRMETEHGAVEICFDDPDTVLLRTQSPELGVRLRRISDGSPLNYVHPLDNRDGTRLLLNCFKNRCRLLLEAWEGRPELRQTWIVQSAPQSEVDIVPGERGVYCALREIVDVCPLSLQPRSYEECREAVRRDFLDFESRMPKGPERFAETRSFMSYVNWSGFVCACGLLKRDAMVMSKNWMTNIWSWDHCFNAMALAEGYPEAAWDQWRLIFDMQAADGVLPDSVNDTDATWNFVKPPIHGWALRYMMERMELTLEQEEDAYRVLEKWTGWWLASRDGDGDGIGEYYHGNDSGWDNATAFRSLPPVEAPDLSAFLIIQMDVLADLARRLGRDGEAAGWTERADALLTRMLEHSFEDGVPVIRRSGTHEIVPCRSLIRFLPLVLGERLPEHVRAATAAALRDGGFFTEWGFATEAPDSPDYVPDGYWRGPIWAPSTMLILDGLSRCGMREWAAEGAEKFCRLVEKSGAAENFDAITGDGLRDRAYTWTSSVFLMLAESLNG